MSDIGRIKTGHIIVKNVDIIDTMSIFADGPCNSIKTALKQNEAVFTAAFRRYVRNYFGNDMAMPYRWEYNKAILIKYPLVHLDVRLRSDVTKHDINKLKLKSPSQYERLDKIFPRLEEFEEIEETTGDF